MQNQINKFLISTRTTGRSLVRFLLVLVIALTTVTSAVYTYTRVLTPAPALAATSSNLNYQARLLTAAGNTVPDGYYNLTFNLYSASSGGSSLWSEQYYDANGVTAGQDNRVRVVNGYLSVNLASQTAFPAIDWDQDMWLTMNVGGSTQTATPTYDGEMNPRIKLTAVPYAFQAKQSEILSKTAGGFTGTVDFGSLTANRKYLFPDTSLATVASPGTICVYNGGASNCPASSGSAYYIQNDTVLQTSSNFNIQARDSGVNGTIGGVVRAAAGGQTVDLFQVQDSSGSPLTAFKADGTLKFYTGSGIVGVDNGSLGIATGNTNGAGDGIDFSVDIDNTAGVDYQTILSVVKDGLTFGPAANPIMIRGPEFRSLVTQSGNVNDSGDELGFNFDIDVTNAENYVRVLTIDGNGGGSVGIGTADPQAKLHVSDTGSSAALFRVTDTTATAKDVLNIADGGAITLQNQTNSDTAFQIQNSSGAKLFSVDTTNGRVQIGNVAAGGNPASAKLYFGDESTANNMWIGEYGGTDSDAFQIQGMNGLKISTGVGATTVVDISGTGAAKFQNSTDSTTAFQIQNAAGTNLFKADTTNSRIEVTGDIYSKGLLWNSRTAANSNDWFSVTYGNGLFVAVATNGTDRVMTSPDGINWTARTAPGDVNWKSVTYGNGLFVAVADNAGAGSNNRVMTSPDGINWTIRTSPADIWWYSVAFGNGMFVAVSETGTGTSRVMTSPDGINWTMRSAAAANSWKSVTYGNGQFVAVSYDGTGNRVMTSPDGITWTSRTNSVDISWMSVTYGNGLYVAVANNGSGTRVMTSPDGITWTTRNNSVDADWATVTYGNGLFVAVSGASGIGTRVMTSPDGITWTTRTSANSGWYIGMAYGNGQFVAVGASGAAMSSGRPELTVTSNNNTYYGGIKVYGNAEFRSDANSTTAFQIQNTAGTSNLLVADTVNTKLGVGMAPVSGGATLQVTGGVAVTMAASNNNGYSSMVTGDALPRFFVQASGAMGWGDGTGAADTNLYRSASGILKTDNSLLINTASNTTTAFRVQRAGNDDILRADTSNNRVYIGDSTASAGTDSTLLIVDNSTTANLPTGVNGGIIYDSTTGHFKVYEAGQYKELCNQVDGACGGSGGGATLQSVYNTGNTLNATDNRDISITLQDTTTDPNFKINIAAGSTGKFEVQNAGTSMLQADATAYAVNIGVVTGPLFSFNYDGGNFTGWDSTTNPNLEGTIVHSGGYSFKSDDAGSGLASYTEKAISSTSSLIYSAWVRVDNNTTTADLLVIKGATSTYTVYIDSSDKLCLFNNYLGANSYCTAGAALADDVWSKLEIRITAGTSGNMKLYQDGTLLLDWNTNLSTSPYTTIQTGNPVGGRDATIYIDDVDVRLPTAQPTTLNANGDLNVEGITTLNGATSIYSTALSAFQIQNAGGTSNLFVANTFANRIGVGTATPSAFFHISSDTGDPLFRITDTTGSPIDVVNISNTGQATFKNQTNSTSAFRVENTSGNAVLEVDTTNSRVGINMQGASPLSALDVRGALSLTGTTYALFDTPLWISSGGSSGAQVGTKINIPVQTLGNFEQLLAFGLNSASSASARAISVFDARNVAHQPSIGVFSPDETDIFGFSWEGSSSHAYVKAMAADITIRSNTTDIATFNTNGTVGIASKLTLNGSGTPTTSADGLQFGGDVNLYRSAGSTLTANAQIGVVRGSSSDNAFLAAATGDTFDRFQIKVDGTISLGSGAAAMDTNLYRSAANTLKTDDNLIVAGATTLQGAATVTGPLSTLKGADYSTNGSANNVSFAAASLIRLTGTAAQTITGIANGTDGYRLTLVNASGFTATISNLSGSSLAANQITTGTGSNLLLPDGASIELIYDSGASLWRVTSGVAATGGVGVNSIGTIDTQTKSANGAVITGTSLVMQTADATHAGLVSDGTAGAQTFGGDKTFNGAVTFAAAGTGLSVTNNATIGGTLAVTGTSTFTALGTFNGGLTVANNSNFSQTGSGTFGTGTGAVSLNGATSVTGTNTFAVGTGATTLGGTLAVTGTGTYTGLGTFNGGVSVANNSNFAQTGTGTFGTGTGAVSLNGATSVTGTNTFTVGTGATSLGGTLAVTGTSTFTGLGTFNGGLTVANNSNFSQTGTGTFGTGTGAVSLNGATSVTGTNALTVGTGATTLGGTLAVTGTGTYTGLGTFNGGVTVANNSNLAQTGTGTFSTGTGTVSLNGATSVTGTNTFTVGTGATALGGTLAVTGTSTFTALGTFNGGLTVANNSNFSQTGTGTFGTGTGAVSLNGNTSVTGTNTFSVGTGATTLGGTLGVTGNTTLTGNLSANGAATFKDTTNSATAFQIQNAGTTPLFTVDTLNSRVMVDNAVLYAQNIDVISSSPSAISRTVRTTGTGTTTVNPYTPAGTFTPNASRVLVAYVAWEANNTAMATDGSDLTISGGSLTWVPIEGKFYKNRGWGDGFRAFYALTTTSPPSNMQVTVDAGAYNIAAYNVRVDEMAGVDLVSPVAGVVTGNRPSIDNDVWTANLSNNPTTSDWKVLLSAMENDVAHGYDTPGGWTETWNPGAFTPDATMQYQTGSSTTTLNFDLSAAVNYAGSDTVYGGFILKAAGGTALNIGTVNAGVITVGNAGSATTFTNGAGGLTVASGVDSASAFQVQTSTGSVLLNIDTSSGTVNVGNGNAATINLQSTSAINIGTNATANTIQIGVANADKDITIGNAQNAGSTTTVEGGTAATGIQIGNGATAHGIQIGTNATGDNDIVVGGTNAGSSIIIQAGTAATAIQIGNNAAATGIQIGNANADKDIIIGNSQNAGSTISLEGGTAATGIQIGNSTAAHGIQIGSNATGDNDILLGGANAGSTLILEAGTAAGAIQIGNGATAHGIQIGTGAAAQTVTVGSTNSTSTLNLQAGSGNINFNASTAQFTEVTGTRTLTAQTRTTNVAGTNITVSAGTAGAGASAFSGGTLTLQGGAAAGTGNAVGGSVTITGGAGVGTGTQGLVNLSTSAFTSATVQTFAASGSLTAGNVDLYSTLPVTASVAAVTVTVPDPAQSVIGRILYLSARSGSFDFTIRLNSTRTPIDIAMKANSTATLIWNGTDWTAAGASSSTDLQSAYNNTLLSAGGAELVLNAPGGNADGFTIRNGATPINGGILEVQSSIGTNLFSVNNLGTELAANGGAETSATFTTNWTAAPAGGTITRTTTAGQFVTGLAGVQAATTAANHGVRNNLSANPVASTTYQVSFTVKASVAIAGNNLEVIYSPDGGTTSIACANYSSQAVTTTGWTKITCTITTTAAAVTNPDLIIRQTDGTTRNIWIDNLSFMRNDATTQPSNVQIGGGINGGPVTLFTLDRSSAPPVANGDTTYLGSMYYDTTTGRIQCYEADGWGACGSAPDNIISLTPEYSGAVLNGTGVGTMTADFCSNQAGILSVNTGFCASGLSRQYYKWTSPQATQQTYSIYVTYKLPNTFKTFNSDSTITLTGYTDNLTNGTVTYEVFRSTGSAVTACGTETTVTTSASTWQTVQNNGNETSCGFAGGDNVIFKVNVKAKSNANVYVENLNFTYINS